MSQHFLLSAKARTLSIPQIMKLTDEQAHALMKTMRWGEHDDDMVCPHCGTVHAPYRIKTRNQYRCKDCQHTFSVTSGTIFANHKLPIKLYLLAIIIEYPYFVIDSHTDGLNHEAHEEQEVILC
jgi:transposase-like protein